ncbi:MAG: hypothetical protein HZA37_02425 [Parcubacteria group bacterium]|nr:hypothetical protein [Parcubacteria group bacterium]
MVQRLKSVLRNPPLRLALKAALFGLALFWVGSSGLIADPSTGRVGPLLFFVFLSSLLYFRRIQHPAFFGSFLVLICAAVIALFFLKGGFGALTAGGWLAPQNAGLAVAGILFFVLTFILLLGTKDLVFANRPAVFYAAANLLFVAVFSLFFLAEKTSYFFIEYFLVFAASFVLFKNIFNFLAPYFPRRHLLIAAVSALTVSEMAWAVALLPLGFINSAALLLTAAYVLSDFSLRHLSGNLKRSAVFRGVVVLAAIFTIILISSRWGI